MQHRLKVKKAFTLAEVLITLTVIGVVASIVVPAMVNNINDAELKSAWKKNYADFAQAYKLMIAGNGGSAVGLFSVFTDTKNKLKNYLNYSKDCNWSNRYECWHMDDKWYELNGSSSGFGMANGLILANGSFIGTASSGNDYTGCTDDIGDSGVRYCQVLYIDVNGWKGPNTVGKDIYEIYLLHDGNVVPAGVYYRYEEALCIQPGMAGWNGAQNEGWACSAKYLKE